ncbi:MAG: ketoacyl-ACP synthase III [bacterium]|nr:ketoacyl-ACP synthase III [bacterium]
MRSKEDFIPAITGIGKAVGRRTISNADVAQVLEKPAGVIERLMKPVGVITRYWVEKGEQVTSDLAVQALLEALEMAGVKGQSLKGITVATSTPDLVAVTTAAIVQSKIGLPKNIRVHDVSAACPGWLHAFYNTINDLASPYGIGGPQGVIGAEITSLFISKNKPMIAPLFGDAAGAVILELVKPDPGAPTIIEFAFGSDGNLAKALCIPAGGSAEPTSEQTVNEDKHTLFMDGKVVRENAVSGMVEVIKKVLEKANLPLEEVDWLIPHQPNLEIIKDTIEEVGFPIERTIITIDHYGNTSAASIPTALFEGVKQERVKRNHKVVFVSFGAGFNTAACVISMNGLPKSR